MKKPPVGVWVALILLACAGTAWWIHGHLTKITPVAQTSPARSAPNSPVVTRIIPRMTVTATSANLWQAYALARQQALQQNPELAAEYKQLQAEMQVQMKKLEAAIVRTDPKTAPIIAKYHAMRERRMAMTDATAPKSPTAPANLSK
jgi:hypothetical protein